MFLELIIAECNRGPALTNPDTATSESEDEPPCKLPTLFAACSKARQKLSREKNVTLRGQLNYSYQYELYQRFNILVHKFCKILFSLSIGY